MKSIVDIQKVAEVTQIQMRVEAGKRDPFFGTLVQSATPPSKFYYGERRTLQHSCSTCGLSVEAEFAFGKQLIGLGSLSRQDFNENRAQLDIVGKLFHQHLDNELDSNGFESYLYLTHPDPDRGALLNVSYYRCPHCQAQYLVSYQRQIKDERPPFEPDEILIDKVFGVAFDHEELLRVLNRH